MTMDLELRFQPSARAPAVARRSLAGLGEILEPGLFENLKLLVTELVTNSIRHARLKPEAEVEVRVAAASDHVSVAVTDPGRGFAPGRDAPRPDPDSGWGLYLVDRLADRWGIVDNGVTTVWFELGRRAMDTPPVT